MIKELSSYLTSFGLDIDCAKQVLAVIDKIPDKLIDYNAFCADYDNIMQKIVQYCGDDALKMLASVSRLSVCAHKRYVELGLNDDMYFDTFSDIGIWAANHLQKYGSIGLSEHGWLQNHIRLKLFRLGRLQFQPLGIDSDASAGIVSVQKQDVVLSVHIPQGEPLNRAECLESYKKAMQFFKGIHIFHCHSWLLNPMLGKLIKTGNIVDFASDYSIYSIDNSDRQAEERIFGTLMDDPADYIGKTTLQKLAREYLMSGEKLGCAAGLFYYK